MDWRDEGVLISARPYGESAAIVEVFTAAHGRHAGVVRGGMSRRLSPHLQPGTQLALTWTARLGEHLGSFTVEPLRSRAAILSDRRALAGLNAVCALVHLSLPEREPHPALWSRSIALLDAMAAGPGWEPAYLAWELALLENLGFGLDLGSCAVTGARDGLAYVSPRSGRAVSHAGAGNWAARLLPLPGLLTGSPPTTAEALDAELVAALGMTGHFLLQGLQPVLNDRPLPEARTRLRDLLSRPPQ